MSGKVKHSMTKEMVAPCGLNCALCSRYLALKYDVKRKGIMIPYCEGCRPRGKACATLKKRCSLILNGEIQFCYECDRFPCKDLKRLDQSYDKFFRVSLVENLKRIKKDGMAAFLKAQRKGSKCPRCGGIICLHNGKCFHCDIAKIKKKGEIGRKKDAKKK
jgi:hypothetical protein